ncbi:uncharacterized protein METZ01_LOCUS161566, partial [marine metagenome]
HTPWRLPVSICGCCSGKDRCVQTAPLRLPSGNFQPFLPPNPFHTL